MSVPPVLPPLICRRCGAPNPPDATNCWLCSMGDHPSLLQRPAASGKGQPIEGPADTLTMLLGLTVACVATAVFIGVGMSLKDPGLVALFLMIAVPAFLASMAGRSAGTGQASGDLFSLLCSRLFILLGSGILVVAALTALFLLCVESLPRDFH